MLASGLKALARAAGANRWNITRLGSAVPYLYRTSMP